MECGLGMELRNLQCLARSPGIVVNKNGNDNQGSSHWLRHVGREPGQRHGNPCDGQILERHEQPGVYRHRAYAVNWWILSVFNQLNFLTDVKAAVIAAGLSDHNLSISSDEILVVAPSMV